MTTLIDIFDSAKRPRGPRFALTSAQRRSGRRLAMIHQMHLDQIEEVEALILRIDAAAAAQDDLAGSIDDLAMTGNYRAFGILCGRECQNLTFHHTSEDAAIFPALRRGDPVLDAVLDRLAEEHLVIHAAIETLLTQIATYRAAPGLATYGTLRESFNTLAALVRSHFGYEQTELEDAIGHYGAPI